MTRCLSRHSREGGDVYYFSDGNASNSNTLYAVYYNGNYGGLKTGDQLKELGLNPAAADEAARDGNNNPVKIGTLQPVQVSLHSPAQPTASGSAAQNAGAGQAPITSSGKGFQTNVERRKDAYDSLPYGKDVKNEWGVIGYKADLYRNSNPIEGTPDAVPYRINRTKDTGIYSTIPGLYGIDGAYPIVEFDHTHVFSKNEVDADAGKFSGGFFPMGDVPLSKTTNIPIYMRYGDSLKVFEPKTHVDRDRYDGAYENYEGRTVCRGAGCF